MRRKLQIKIPYQFKELANSYRYGFGDGYGGKTPEAAIYFKTLAAQLAYDEGFVAGQKKASKP